MSSKTPQSQEMTVEQFGYTQELKRALSLKDLIIYGLIIMVPIAPFGIYGYVVSGSQGLVALAYLIGMVSMVFTAFSYARMSEAFPIAGSVYSYAGRAISESVGFFSGWVILMDYVLVPALLYIVSGAAMNAIVPGIPVFAWALAFIAVNTLINIRGIEFTAKFNKIVLVLELVILAGFLALGLSAVARGVPGTAFSFTPFYEASVFSMDLVMAAVSIAVLSYLGFDGISTLAEETHGGFDTVGKATVASLLMVGVLFIVQTWVAGMIWPDWQGLTNLDTAFYTVAERAGGPALLWTCSLATGFSWGIANSLAAQAAVSRILYSMARDRYLPSPLAKIHPTFKSPYVATLFVAAVSVVVCYIFADRIGDITSIVNFGALTSFLVLHLCVINHFIVRNKSRDYLRHLIFPLLGFAIIGYVWISLDTAAKTLGAWWIGIGIVYFLILTYVFKRKPTKLEV